MGRTGIILTLIAFMCMAGKPIVGSLSQGLQGYWTMDERGGKIVSGNSSNRLGTCQSTLLMKYDGCNLTGVSGEYILVPNFTWPATSGITISFWNKSAGGSTGSIISHGNPASSSTNLINCHAPFSDNTIYWDYGTNVNGRISTSYTNYLNKWTHVCLVNNGTNLKAIYLNGVLITSSATVASPPALSTQNLNIGSWVAGGYHHKGTVNNFGIWSRALTHQEIQAIYVKDKPFHL